jgi:predicted polyphosphate/ATP-dependent NAD kinase
VDQLDIYWERLFADPIAVNTAAGVLLVQPQRTNNVLEQFFRRLMRTYRKRNGFASVEKVLRSMSADTPLVMNLNNAEYMKILLAGKTTLEERFAEVDAREIRERMVRESMISGSACPRIRKIIRLPQLPKAIVTLLQQSAS